MNFKTYFNLLVEATREDIKKFYPKISDEDYNKILDSDPTGTKNKVGNLSRLVLDLYKKDQGNFLVDDSTFLHDIYTAVDNVQRKKNNLTGTEFEKYKNLNLIPSVVILLRVDHYIEANSTKKIKIKANEGENYDVFFENDKWEVLIPNDYKTSVKIGRECNNARWCTASSDAESYYSDYTKSDYLYIFKNKKDPKESYQYHSRIKNFDRGPEFNDVYNNPTEIGGFEKKEHLENVFKKIRESTNTRVQGEIENITVKDFDDSRSIVELLKLKKVEPSQKAIDNFNKIAMSLNELNAYFLRVVYPWLTKVSKKYLLSFIEGEKIDVTIRSSSYSDYVPIDIEGVDVLYFYKELDCESLAKKTATTIWKKLRGELEKFSGYQNPSAQYGIVPGLSTLNSLTAPGNKDRENVLSHFGKMYQKLNSYEETRRINTLDGKEKEKAIEKHIEDLKNVLKNIEKFGQQAY